MWVLLEINWDWNRSSCRFRNLIFWCEILPSSQLIPVTFAGGSIYSSFWWEYLDRRKCLIFHNLWNYPAFSLWNYLDTRGGICKPKGQNSNCSTTDSFLFSWEKAKIHTWTRTNPPAISKILYHTALTLSLSMWSIKLSEYSCVCFDMLQHHMLCFLVFMQYFAIRDCAFRSLRSLAPAIDVIGSGRRGVDEESQASVVLEYHHGGQGPGHAGRVLLEVQLESNLSMILKVSTVWLG